MNECFSLHAPVQTLIYNYYTRWMTFKKKCTIIALLLCYYGDTCHTFYKITNLYFGSTCEREQNCLETMQNEMGGHVRQHVSSFQSSFMPLHIAKVDNPSYTCFHRHRKSFKFQRGWRWHINQDIKQYISTHISTTLNTCIPLYVSVNYNRTQKTCFDG